MINKKPSVLIVDDEQVICDLLNEELSERGYLCTTVLSGDDALDKLTTEDFDAVCWISGYLECPVWRYYKRYG